MLRLSCFEDWWQRNDTIFLDKTVHGLQQTNTLIMLQLQLSRQLGNSFAERVGKHGLRWLNFASVIVVVVRMLLVQISLRKCTLRVSFVSLETK